MGYGKIKNSSMDKIELRRKAKMKEYKTFLHTYPFLKSY